mmetsp:Transcript_7882/g.18007  ORF Transcript_7882/g.18007 Transcript_7882/m.18007 type:complete len:373 (+) Transcript_7882:87-1205(+)
MGAGASARKRPDALAVADSGGETAGGAGGADPAAAPQEEKERPLPTDTRSKEWRRAWRLLLEYEWSPEDDEYEDHPEDSACAAVKQAVKERGLEARAKPGFIAGKCLLHLAAERGAAKSVLVLLEAGANPELADKYKDTPLHCAAKEGRCDVIDLLLEFGGDPLLKNRHGKTACAWADDFNQPEAAALLRAQGGDPPVEPKLPFEVSEDMADELGLTVKQIAGYREAFDLFDEDGSGELSTEELGNVVRSIGFQVSEAEVVDMVEEADEDRSGALDFVEFLILMARRFGDMTTELNEEDLERQKVQLSHALREFDEDKSGTLSHAEFMRSLMDFGEPLTDSQAEEILTNLDAGDADEMNINYDKLAQILSEL